MRRVFTAAFLFLFLTACAPTAVVSSLQRASPLPANEGFLVTKETEIVDEQAKELGDIYIKDAGLAVNCSYEKVLALATNEARQLGANVLQIYEHQVPDMRSTCHRIRAKALRVPDLSRYEKEIVWHPSRRLKQADFKGSTESRPFEAATSSNIRYKYMGRVFQDNIQLTVETFFNCQESYFKGTQDVAHTLEHEQGHFDITEIQARRFVKAIKEQVADTKELEIKHETIYRQIISEAQRMHDKYDSEIYPDHSKQAAWLQQIEQQLNDLQPFADKQVAIKVRL
ncbi:hypothetical protein [Hymenobacter sp. HDW8]|uniref:hypothetical protein n=1 Tax=Hymenobacter sp. HDW8 TaxID=2714932 RepID=UPI00140B8B67|nr:hypothetical protein [Hymenobacter sp. HDW8]QIL76183.1 hypothetical protein G7064_10190 [Hymenobacter sp. HDW8]